MVYTEKEHVGLESAAHRESLFSNEQAINTKDQDYSPFIQ